MVPLHVILSEVSSYPGWQKHLNDPFVLKQNWWHGDFKHSSTSIKKSEIIKLCNLKRKLLISFKLHNRNYQKFLSRNFKTIVYCARLLWHLFHWWQNTSFLTGEKLELSKTISSLKFWWKSRKVHKSQLRNLFFPLKVL